jgi:MFS family permease
VRRLPAGAFWPLACFFALGSFWGAWAALLPDIREQVGASDGELGLAMLGAGAGALPAMLLTGRLWRRFDWRLLPVTAALYAVATLGPALAGTPIHLALALFFVGAASGALDVAMNAAVSDVEAATGARLMYGAHALFSLSVLLGSVATGLAREAGAGPWLILGAVAAVLAVAAVGSIRVALGRRHTAEATHGGERAPRVRARAAFAILAALCATALLIEDAVQNWSALHLERTLLVGPAIGGAGPGVFAGAMFLGRAMGQGLGARLSERALVGGGAIISAVGLLLTAAAGHAVVALLGLGLCGAGIALVAPALYARAGRLAGARGRGAAIAALTFFGYMGFLAGPVLMGNIAQVGGLRVAFAALAVLAVLLAGAAAVLLESSGRAGVLARGAALLRTGRG